MALVHGSFDAVASRESPTGDLPENRIQSVGGV